MGAHIAYIHMREGKGGREGGREGGRKEVRKRIEGGGEKSLHLMMLESLEAEYTHWSSGAMATHVTGNWWPRNKRISSAAGGWYYKNRHSAK